jgi:hypothetical protein
MITGSAITFSNICIYSSGSSGGHQGRQQLGALRHRLVASTGHAERSHLELHFIQKVRAVSQIEKAAIYLF